MITLHQVDFKLGLLIRLTGLLEHTCSYALWGLGNQCLSAMAVI
jgi:hypothetical protein